MYEIKWTSSAKKRYYNTLEFWIGHNHSSEYSIKIVSEVDKIETLLKENPYLGKLVWGTKEPTRKILILRHFSLFYTITGKTIEIVFFFDNRDNPKKLELL